MSSILTSRPDLVSAIARATGVSPREAVPAARLTTMACGADVPLVAEPQSIAEVSALLSFCRKEAVPFRLLGAGSNVVLPDAPVEFLLVRLGKGFRTLSMESPGRFQIGAAYSLMSGSRELSEQGWAGLEFAGGIPGVIGGAVAMNAGAHGGEMADILSSITVVLPDGSVEELSAASLAFRYRHSELPPGAVVVSARLALSESDRAACAERRRACLEERKRRQPLSLPSSGSVFRNPSPERSAGFLIEQCGLKGAVEGGARISELHANWIVNPERTARAADIWALVARAQQAVKERFSTEIVPEVIRW